MREAHAFLGRPRRRRSLFAGPLWAFRAIMRFVRARVSPVMRRGAGLAVAVFLTCVVAVAVLGRSVAVRILDSAIAYVASSPLSAGVIASTFDPEAPRAELSVEFQNHGSTPVRVVGLKSACDCVVCFDLPVQIEPQTARSVRISPKNDAWTSLEFVFFTDCPAQPEIVVPWNPSK